MNFKNLYLILFFVLSLHFACMENPVKKEANAFLKEYTEKFQKLDYEANKAAWLANTDISEEHDSLSVLADKALSEFVGSKEVIEKTKSLLEQKDKLDRMQVLQLNKVLLTAAHRPGTIPEVVEKLINAETKQNSLLYGFDFVMRDKRGKAKIVSTNEIDRILVESKDLDKRLEAWEASKEVGKVLKDGLANLQSLRNQVAREMGYSSFFALEVADYGLSVQEMMELMDQLVEGIRPFYSELHTYIRYELAKRYNQPVPDKIPAHWLPNRWGQNWPGIVEAVNLDDLFKDKTKEWIVKQAEDFYVSIGFDTLNKNFWERSDLYPVEEGSKRKKNNHASAWHLDSQDDYRSLMSVEPNNRWFRTAHHELGHIYYYIEYSNPDVPILLRRGANRSYHEGIGSLMAIASSQRPYLEQLGLLSEDVEIDQIQWLLNDALSSSSVVFIPFAAGTMSHFEHDLYEKDLPKDQFNKRWWEYVEKYQGIVPPSQRGEEYCDAASKTHINNDPAQYYDYALSCVLKFHLHDYIARKILKQDPHNCNYYGNKEVGEFLKNIMRPGASKDWRKVLKEKTGEDLSARAMLEYYRPLIDYLKKANEGRESVVASL
ncbi:MAG: M2 family metallopeptidase [bacterium]